MNIGLDIISSGCTLVFCDIHIYCIPKIFVHLHFYILVKYTYICQIYECMSRTRPYELFTRFKSDREDLNEAARYGRPEGENSAELV